MTDHYVSYEQAVKLKKFGFDWKCYDFYTEDVKIPLREIKPFPKPKNWNDSAISGTPKISAPSIYQTQEWLGEEKKWHIQVRINGVRSAYWYEIWSTIPNGPVYGTPDDESFQRGQFDTYEMALSEGIEKVLNLLEE